MVDGQVEKRKVEETLKRVYFVETGIFMAERIVIPVCMSVFPDVNPTALFLCFSTFFYNLGFKNRAVAISQTSLQRRRRYFDRSLEVEGDNKEDENGSRVMKEVEGDNDDDGNDYNSEDDDDSEDDDNHTTSLLEHHKDTVDAFNEDRYKWEEENANLKSDMEELISQNEENTLSLMNCFEDHCRKSMADKELLRAKLRAAKQSKKYYRGMIRELENMRLQLLEDNKQLVARLEEATMQADHYYIVLHNFDERGVATLAKKEDMGSSSSANSFRDVGRRREWPEKKLKIDHMSAIDLREMKQAQVGTRIMVYRGVDFQALNVFL
ncbi:hypothetical protein FNV43_RR21879 [Rhamnella rubrinervis]|uniref:Uncharacterized protein n=1 Tax=Rhamnella rubrinervis TaxID=2594499 RepID=A0A8K0DV39_9ROSA|nr:hypothetical protein FNV43_RR21879 [Rhamnella rubrinervis]